VQFLLNVEDNFCHEGVFFEHWLHDYNVRQLCIILLIQELSAGLVFKLVEFVQFCQTQLATDHHRFVEPHLLLKFIHLDCFKVFGQLELKIIHEDFVLCHDFLQPLAVVFQLESLQATFCAVNLVVLHF